MEQDAFSDRRRNYSDRACRYGTWRPRRLKFLRKRYGGRRWRKLKGIATVRLASGSIPRAEVHRYEPHGAGRKGWKIKRCLD